EEECRPCKSRVVGNPYGILDIKDIPKGKLSIVEALTVLNKYKCSPKSWTPNKIAQEYSLDLKDTKALLEFFILFDVKIIPPKTEDKKSPLLFEIYFSVNIFWTFVLHCPAYKMQFLDWF
ncbi:NDUF4 factor, partial [Atractosteus spatula]|nr:NDUF4 factor [Atractosteus spatula]